MVVDTGRKTSRLAMILGLAAVASLGVVGCDTDRSGRGRNNGVAEAPVRIEGTVQAGPLNGATVVAEAVNPDGTIGQTIGQAATDAAGNFAMVLNSDSAGYTGPVVLRASGGTFVDEGTGQTVTLTATLTSVLPNLPAFDPNGPTPASRANVTILTTLAAEMARGATGGFTEANMTAANAAVNTALGGSFDILITSLANPADAANATNSLNPDINDHTIAVAGASQLAANQNTDPNTFVNNVKSDVSDGRLDGLGAAGAQTANDASIALNLARAILAFNTSAQNARGLVASNSLLNALGNFDGNLARNTVPGLDKTNPEVVRRFPAAGASNVARNSVILIQFSEEVDASTVTTSNILVSSSTNGGQPVTVPGTVAFDAGTNVAAFTPSALLGSGDSISVSVTNGVLDLGGNPLGNTDNFSFTVGTMSAAGNFSGVIAISPSGGNTVDPNTGFIVTIPNQTLDPRSLSTVSVNVGGTVVASKVSYMLGSSTFTVTPVFPLTNGANVVVTIPGTVSNSAQGQSGADRTFTSTVTGAGIADTTRPTVANIDPANGSNTSQSGDLVTVQFSEQMNASTVLAATQITSNSAPVAGKTFYSAENNTLTFTPDQPFAAGATFTVTISTSAQDLAGNSLLNTFTSTFSTGAPNLTIATTQLPNGVVGLVYSQGIQIVGGTAPFTYSLGTTTLPAGLTLDPSSGVISGTPTTAGTTNFTVTVSDSGNPVQMASQNYALTIDPAAAVPTVSFQQAASATVDEATQSFTVNLVLSTPNGTTLSDAVTARVSVIGGTATPGTDFLTFNPTTVTFPAGSGNGLIVSVTIGVLADPIFENDETILLNIDNVAGANAILGAAATHTVTITNDDPTPTATLDPNNALSVNEGTMSSVGVVLSNPTINTVTVPFTVTGTATNSGPGADHTLQSGTIVVPAGQTSASTSFMVNSDGTDEDDTETIVVTIGTPTPSGVATLGTPSTQTINVIDQDGPGTVSINDLPMVMENAGTADFTVTLSPAHGRSANVSVDFMIAGVGMNPATEGANADFTVPTMTTVTFAAGETTKTISVPVVSDMIDEFDESFDVTLTNPMAVVISQADGTGSATIIDDDAEPSVSFDNPTATVSEGTATLTVTVSLDNAMGSGKSITIPFMVDGASTAIDPDDYTITGNSGANFPTIAATTMPPGVSSTSITINIVDDNISELMETIVLTLGTPVNAMLGNNTTSTITINDNEGNPSADLNLMIGGATNPATVAEDGGMVTATVNLSNPSSQTITGRVMFDGTNTTLQPADFTDQDAAGDQVRLYIGRDNNGTTPGTVLALNPMTGEQEAEFSIGADENVAIDTEGNLYFTNSNGSVRRFVNVSNRALTPSFDPNALDSVLIGANTTLQGARGIDVDTARGRLFVCDFAGTKMLVFDRDAVGDVAPLGSTDLSNITGVSGRPWDVDYEPADDRLFVAMTDGNLLIYDNYLGSGNFGANGPERTLRPQANNVNAVNLHGVIYNKARDEIYIADVGLAGSDNDGQLFVIANGATAGAAPSTNGNPVVSVLNVVTGTGIRLGNPVDINYANDTLYVVEKTSIAGATNASPAIDRNHILVYENFTTLINPANSGALVPTRVISLPLGTAPESIAVDAGLRIDNNFVAADFSIAPGQTSATISFKIFDDVLDETDKVLALTIANLMNADPGTVTRSTTVTDNDNLPVVSINSVTVDEGGLATLVISLDAASAQTVTGSYMTTDGTAVSTEDYTAVMSTPFTFVPGDVYESITVQTTDDLLNEIQEQFNVVLDGNPVNATAGTLTGTVDIVDNDAQPTINLAVVGNATVDENVGTISFTATLDAASGQTITADVSLMPVSSTFGSGDFTFMTQNLTFAPGETTKTITVDINDDDINEINEQFNQVLMITNNSPAMAGTTTVLITINDNDDLSLTLSTGNTGVEGGAAATFTAALSRVSEQTPITFDLTVGPDGNDPTEAGDIIVPATVTFSGSSVSETVTVMVVDDMVNENDEGFSLTAALNGQVRGFTGGTLTATNSVEDNDMVNVTLTKTTDGAEPGTNATFTATLNIASEQTITFSAMAAGSGNDPTESGDITSAAGITFNPGSQSEILTVTVNDDMVNEATETFTETITLTSTTNNFDTAGSTLTATADVADDDTLTLTVANVRNGDENGPVTAQFSATLNRMSELQRDFTINTSTATNPSPAASFQTDYDLPAGTGAAVQFSPGTTMLTIDMVVNDDMVNEAMEQFTINLTLDGNMLNGFVANTTAQTATATIADDDILMVQVVADGTTTPAAEDSGTNQVFNIGFAGPVVSTEQNFTVAFVGENGTPVPATLNVDYQLPTVQNVTFQGAPGTSVGGPIPISVNILDDMINEANETYNIRLTTISGSMNNVQLVNMPTASATINDNDMITLNIVKNNDGAENGAGTPTDISFTVTLVDPANTATTRMSEQTITIDVANAGGPTGDPAETADFSPASDTLTFAPGETTKSLTITVNEDMDNEANETVQSTLTRNGMVNGFVDGPNQGGTFLADSVINDDDDVTVTLAVGMGPFPEGMTGGTNTVSFVVSISGVSQQNVQAMASTAETTTAVTMTDDATSGTDFDATPVPATVTVTDPAMPQTFVVNIIGDMDPEQNETFLAMIAEVAQLRGVTVDTTPVTATITDDDNATVDLQASTGDTNEGDTLNVIVTLNGPKSGPVTVDLTDTLGGTATNGIDTTDERRAFPFTPVALYVVGNDGGSSGVDRLGNNLALQATYTVNGNEGSVLDTDGNLYVNADDSGVGAIRIFTTVAGRMPGAAFDPNTDRIIRGGMTGLTNPKGIDIDSNRGLIFVADFGATNLKVFKTTDSGDVAPTGTTMLSVKPWDLDYDSVNDRLFVVMTDGTILVFDDYTANNSFGAGGPSRTITPADGGTKSSINLHGIAYDQGNDRLIVSDVGDAGNAADGAIFVIETASTADGLTQFEGKVEGPLSLLGNPVDLVFDGTNVFIAEKSNNRVLVFPFASLPTGNTTIDLAASASFMKQRPESIALDRGIRRDHDFAGNASAMAGTPTGARVVTFAPSEVSKTIPIIVAQDIRNEVANETLELNIANVTGDAMIGMATQSFNLVDDDPVPTIMIAPGSLNESQGGIAPLNFNITLSAPSGRSPSGVFNTMDGTATTADNDYTAVVNRAFTIREGEVFIQQGVMITADDRDEADETLTGQIDQILLATPTGPLTATGTIINDDNMPEARVALAQASVGGVTEGNTGATNTIDFEVTLTDATGAPFASGKEVTVTINTTGGTATAGSDFTALVNQTVTFPAGTTSRTVSVAILPDMINEANQTVMVTISAPLTNTNISVGNDTATGTINDDDDITIAIVSGATLAVEGDTGVTTPLGFALTASGPSEQMITVDFLTNGNGNATAGTDFTAITTAMNVNFAPDTVNPPTAVANVDVLGDLATELDETFGVTLNSVVTGRGVTIDQTANMSTGTITDDDAVTVAITPNAGTVTEGSPLTFDVTVSGKPGVTIGQTITVNLVTNMTVNGDPAEAGDIGTLTTPITFTEAAPSTLTMTAMLPTMDDSVNEANEEVNVAIDSVMGNDATIGTPSSALGTINDNDDIMLVITNNPGVFTITEGTGTTPVTITRSGATEQSIDFMAATQESMNVSARGSAPDRDFAPQGPNTLNVNAATASVDFNILVDEDMLFEQPETFDFVLSGLTARGVTFENSMTSQTSTVTITDNDNAPDLTLDAANVANPFSEAGGPQTFTVNLSARPGQDVTFQVDTIDGTVGVTGAASSGNTVDFDAINAQMITFPALTNTLSMTFTVNINDDMVNEADETFQVQISNVQNGAATINGTAGPQAQTATISANDDATISINNPTAAEAAGTMDFTATINIPTQQQPSISFVTADVTALAPGDYTAVTAGTSTFDGQANFGVLANTLQVTINDDDRNEPSESLTVTISPGTLPANVTIPAATSVGTGTIIDNDALAIVITTPANPVAEGAGPLTFNVNFVDPANPTTPRLSEQAIQVGFASNTNGLTGDPAEAGDFTIDTASPLTFPELTTTLPISVSITDDMVNEASEQFNITISLLGTPDNVTILTDTGLGEITDNDPVTVDIVAGVTVQEDGGTATFNIQLTQAGSNPAVPLMTEQTFSVQIDTAVFQGANAATPGATPVAPTDFITATASLNFGPGVNMATFPVTIVDDTPPINEPAENFNVTLSAPTGLPSGVSLGQDTQVGNIVDNDNVDITITPTPNPPNEGDMGSTQYDFIVTLTGLTEQVIALDYVIETGGTVPATAGADFQASTATITFQPNTTVSPRMGTAPAFIQGDLINEANQTFQLRVVNTASLPGGVNVLPTTAIGTIIDDDDLVVTLANANSPIDESVAPATTANFNLNFMNPLGKAVTTTEQAFTINFQALDGLGNQGVVAAVNGLDFNNPNTNVAVNGTSALPVTVAGITASVTIIQDTINEPTEDFRGQISNLLPIATRGITIGTPSTTTFVITDDDVAVIDLRVQNGTVIEGNNAVFELFFNTADPDNTATGTTQIFNYDFFVDQLATPQARVGVDFGVANNTFNTTPVTRTVNAGGGTIIFAANPVGDTITIDTADDAINEANEDFIGMAQNEMGEDVEFAMGTSATATQTIVDNDAISFSIAVDQATITELDPGGNLDAVFTITRAGADATEQTFSIGQAFNVGGTDTALDTTDYTSAGATQTPVVAFTGTFTNAQTGLLTTSSLTVPVINDDVNEVLNEMFSVSLTISNAPTPAGVTINGGPATQIIQDDDLAVFSITVDAPAAEGTTRVFTLATGAGNMASSTDQTFSIDFTTQDGDGVAPATDDATSIAPIDFTLTTDSYNFTPGAAVPGTNTTNVATTDDTVNETNEVFRGTISVGAVSNISLDVNSVVATINDNDDITLVITTVNSPLIESTTNASTPGARFLIRNNTTATTDTEQAFSVNFTTLDGTAISGAQGAGDFDAIPNAANNGVVTFGMGTIFTTPAAGDFNVEVVIVDDILNENNETFTGQIVTGGADDVTAITTDRGVTIDVGNSSAQFTVNDNDDIQYQIAPGATVNEPDTGTNATLTFTIRPNPLGVPQQTEQMFFIPFQTVTPNGTPAATAGTDFTAVPTTNVTINNNNPSIGTIGVTVIGDNLHELTEFVGAMISAAVPQNGGSARGITVDTATVDGSIVDNDNIIVVIDPTSAGSESDGTAVTANTVSVTVRILDAATGTQPRASQEDIVISVAGAGGAGDPAEPNGTAGGATGNTPDFAFQDLTGAGFTFTANNGTSGTLTIPGNAGTMTAMISVGIGDDDHNENTESVASTISAGTLPATGVAIGGANTNNLSIVDDDLLMVDLVAQGTNVLAESNNSEVAGVSNTVSYQLQLRPATSGDNTVDKAETAIDYNVTGVSAGAANNATPPAVANNDYVFDLGAGAQNVNPAVIQVGANTVLAGAGNLDRNFNIIAIGNPADPLGDEPTEVYRLQLSQIITGGAAASASITVPTPNEDGNIVDNPLLNLNNANLATQNVAQTVNAGNTVALIPTTAASTNGIAGTAQNFATGDSLVISSTGINGDTVDLPSFGALVVDSANGQITRGGNVVATFANNAFPTTGNFTVTLSFTGGGISSTELAQLVNALQATGGAAGHTASFNFAITRNNGAALPTENRTSTLQVN